MDTAPVMTSSSTLYSDREHDPTDDRNMPPATPAHPVTPMTFGPSLAPPPPPPRASEAPSPAPSPPSATHAVQTVQAINPDITAACTSMGIPTARDWDELTRFLTSPSPVQIALAPTGHFAMAPFAMSGFLHIAQTCPNHDMRRVLATCVTHPHTDIPVTDNRNEML